MDPLTVLVGNVAFLIGLYTLYLRRTHPAKLTKLEAMKERWGENAGSAVHFIAYSAIPIVFGLVLIFRGLRGGSLF